MVQQIKIRLRRHLQRQHPHKRFRHKPRHRRQHRRNNSPRNKAGSVTQMRIELEMRRVDALAAFRMMT